MSINQPKIASPAHLTKDDAMVREALYLLCAKHLTIARQFCAPHRAAQDHGTSGLRSFTAQAMEVADLIDRKFGR